MYSWLMFLLCALDAVLLGWVARQWLELRQPSLGLLAFLILALPYDTALVGAGRWIGQGELLEGLSGPRFMLFSLSLPLTLVLAAALARLGGVTWLGSRWAMGSVCLLATGFILADWHAILLFPDLHPACWEDTLRYVPSVLPEQASTPGQDGVGAPAPFPPAALVALPMLVAAGALVWWQSRWPWMLAGTLVSFLLLGLPANRFGPIPGFAGDALNMLALAVTGVHFARIRRWASPSR